MKKAFTMSEVLITIGILGVVIAMTLPALIQKKKEKETAAKLKKVYTTLDQAFMFARNQHGGVENWGLESAGMNANPDEDEITFNNTVRARFWEIMSPYFNTLIKCSKISTGECGSYERYSLDGTHFGNFHPYIVLSDGTSIVGTTVADGSCNAVYGNNKQLQNVCGELMVDLNGANPPNATGKDVFIFYYTKYGVIPVGTEMETHFTFENYCNIGKTAIQNGYGCAGLVIYNENMDYLHCNTLSWKGKHKCK